jgi:hypothetical protein
MTQEEARLQQQGGTINKALPLPEHYKLLNKLFIAFDNQLNYLKARRHITSFNVIKSGIEQSLGRQVTQELFEQFLFLEPEFFIYRWEARQGGKFHDLIIEVPRNIKAVLEKPDVRASPKGMEKELKSEVLWKRKTRFYQ